MNYTIESGTIYGLLVLLGLVLIIRFAYQQHKKEINKFIGFNLEPKFKWLYTIYTICALLVILLFGIKSIGITPEMVELNQASPSDERKVEIEKIKEENNAIMTKDSPASDVKNAIDSYNELVKRLTNN